MTITITMTQPSSAQLSPPNLTTLFNRTLLFYTRIQSTYSYHILNTQYGIYGVLQRQQRGNTYLFQAYPVYRVILAIQFCNNLKFSKNQHR